MTRVVRPGFRARVYAVVRTVPAGSVTTYGDVASVLGSPRVARHVGWALAALPSDTDVPWHRVVNARGAVPSRGEVGRAEVQRRRLAAESVLEEAADRIDLARVRHRFDVDEVAEALQGLDP